MQANYLTCISRGVQDETQSTGNFLFSEPEELLLECFVDT